jgi:hypothetical protein
VIEIVRGPTRSPVSTGLLLRTIENLTNLTGVLYTGYPVIGLQNVSAIDGFLIMKDRGLVIFDIVEDSKPVFRIEERDELFNAVHSRLLSNKDLARSRGRLKFELNVFTFAPGWPESAGSPETFCTAESLAARIRELPLSTVSDDDFRKLIAEIQAITHLRPKTNRVASKPNSKGAILNEAEKSIANLDRQQSRAVIETSYSIQRIRGLAGSGKTIVLNSLHSTWINFWDPNVQ